MERVNQGKYAPLVGSYYVAPPDAPVNYATAFMAGFHRTRTPYAQEVFKRRLDALDPTAQAEALNAADGNIAELIKQGREWEKDRQSFALEGDKLGVEVFKAQEQTYRDITTANIDAKTRRDVAAMDAAVKQSQLSDVPDSALKPDTLTAREEAKSAAARLSKARAAYEAGQLDQASWQMASQEYAQRHAAVLEKAAAQGDLSLPQLASLDKQLRGTMDGYMTPFRGLDANGVPVKSDNDQFLDTLVTFTNKDKGVGFEYAAADLERFTGGGAKAGPRPTAPATGGGSVSYGVERGTSGGAPGGAGVPVSSSAGPGGGSAFPGQIESAIAGVEATKARIGDLYKSPYGGFNDPLPGTAVGMMGGKARNAGAYARKEAAADAVARAQAQRRGGPAKGSQEAADATPPAQQAAARAAAASPARPITRTRSLSATVAADLGDPLDALQPPQSAVDPNEPTSSARPGLSGDVLAYRAGEGVTRELPEARRPAGMSQADWYAQQVAELQARR
jgi:hypothetical protein